MHYEHVDDITLHTYTHAYLYRYSEFTMICFDMFNTFVTLLNKYDTWISRSGNFCVERQLNPVHVA